MFSPDNFSFLIENTSVTIWIVVVVCGLIIVIICVYCSVVILCIICIGQGICVEIQILRVVRYESTGSRSNSSIDPSRLSISFRVVRGSELRFYAHSPVRLEN